MGAGGLGGGVYQDLFGTFWEFDCGYSYTGGTYYDGTFVGTYGNGVLTCFYGCSNRIGCMGFSHAGTQGSSPDVGSGGC